MLLTRDLFINRVLVKTECATFKKKIFVELDTDIDLMSVEEEGKQKR